MYIKDCSLIIAIVNRGYSDNVLQSAKQAGAEGATIINARGNSIHETDTVLGVNIQPEKEVVMIIVRKPLRKKVMREICKTSGLAEEGQGLCFSVPVDEVGGINHLLSKSPRPIQSPKTLTQQKSENKPEPKSEKEPQKTEESK